MDHFTIIDLGNPLAPILIREKDKGVIMSNHERIAAAREKHVCKISP